jgi:high-affinity nickel-transport protein
LAGFERRVSDFQLVNELRCHLAASAMRRSRRRGVVAILKGAYDMSSRLTVFPKGKVMATFLVLISANVLIWSWAWLTFSDRPTLLGTALLAYIFGLRHAFDPDHIAAIDNVVRKLMQDNRPSISSGFFFALGHSSIVIIASVAISGTAVTFEPVQMSDINIVRTVVSALFLLAIGGSNIFVLRDIWRAFSRLRRGEEITEDDLKPLSTSGPLVRFFRPLFGIVSRSWHMFPIGFLFGLGFDTATEIGLFGISATQAAQGMSFWAILIFPLLFAAGMTLMDTADSAMMTGAYGWAFVNPVRKLWYNLTITCASVMVAIFIGTLEALGIVADRFSLDTMPWSTVRHLNNDIADLGYIVVGIFVASWLLSTFIYRIKGYHEMDLAIARQRGSSGSVTATI